MVEVIDGGCACCGSSRHEDLALCAQCAEDAGILAAEFPDDAQATMDDLRARLTATEAKLAAARLALAACREVREARES